ncbi:Hypersensitive-induced response protein 1 [Hondaea fermentalgiana]|uniref:Hypersensitive-induced response protein 1 n=1 Tax=Hondaea fermentalgiana TaxID=2315210 RepID=A0A2R5G5L3_9STRA|nr:Hypersensitive-induced response protein 1 [Hondaea fermentalgiana]|eukprot:GBG26342.1 Hypersensitive-induced response protein 1 [Hondaea fermentalgiana]
MSGARERTEARGGGAEGGGEWLPESLGAALKVDPKVVSKFITQSRSKSNLVCSVFMPRGTAAAAGAAAAGPAAVAAAAGSPRASVKVAASSAARRGETRMSAAERDDESPATATLLDDDNDLSARAESEYESSSARKTAFLTQDDAARDGEDAAEDSEVSNNEKEVSKACPASVGRSICSSSSCSSDDDDNEEDNDEASLSMCSSTSSLDVRMITDAARADTRETGQLAYAQACIDHGVVPTTGLIDNLDKPMLSVPYQLMSDNAVVALCAALQVNELVEVLDVSHNNMGETGAEALGDVVAKRPNLRGLSVSGNRLGNDAGLSLASGIRRSREGGLFALCMLDLSNNKLGDRFAMGLSRALLTPCVYLRSWKGFRRLYRSTSGASNEDSDGKQLVALNLSKNIIGAGGARAIAEAFEGQAWGVKDLDLGWNVVKAGGAIPLLKATSQCSVLQKLVLSWNSIDDEAAAAIGELIASSSSLCLLDLSHNQLGPITAGAVRDALPNTSSLRTLEIGFNPFGIGAALSILEGVKANESLRYLGIENPVVPGAVRSGTLVIWAWAVAVVCLAPWVFYRLQQLKLDVDLQAKEPVYSLTEICRRRDKFAAISRIWCHDFEFGNFPVVMPILMFPAVAFAIIVKLGALRTTILLTTQVAVYILVMGFYLSPDEERAEMQGILGQLAFILPTIILFLFSPRNSHIWLASLGLVAVSGLGLFLMEAYDVLKGMGDLIFLCMMWPIIREFFYFAARKTARFAAMSPDFGGGAIEVRRRYAWSLVLVIQVFLATWFRLMATKINDRTRYIIFLMLSSIQEIVFRVTIRERENLLASAARFRSLRRSESGTFRDRRNSVVAPVTQRRVSKTSHKVSHELAETEWYAMLSLGEMLAEHLALWLVLGLILISRGSVLTLPLPFFNELEHPFDDKPNIKPYILLTFGQLIAEILSIEDASECARKINGSSKSAEAVRVAPKDAGTHRSESPIWAQPRPSLRGAVYWALSLSARLAACTFLVALVSLLPWLFFRVQQLELDISLAAIAMPNDRVIFVERCGKYMRQGRAGLNLVACCVGECVAGSLSLRVQQLDVSVETKTIDNVFINVGPHVTFFSSQRHRVMVSVQYEVQLDQAYEAFYKLTNPRSQITSYVFDSIRSSVPKHKLDDVFDSKDEIAAIVKKDLSALEAYGYTVVQTLLTDINPNRTVKEAMNEINAAQRKRVAATDKAEAEKILVVKAAEADAESKYLAGVGIARQRQAIVEGLRESVKAFSNDVSDVNSQQVLELMLMTQYMDTLKEIGAQSKSSTVFVPSNSNDAMSQIRSAFMQAHAANGTIAPRSSSMTRMLNNGGNAVHPME